ncbi:uncharacterized protein LOC128922892 [Zeugodacus cucurbitae]|nr:uncharacterized protein LOC128920443 [Zeugodacus cucurbitae]XP_054083679.1 uncharacterized protein LOC128920443 [Zeugodacus cucurbitae]XP_054084257.1 uncharacterized protein LOC128920568 [Zeugodacus cucurbitae]XP_054084258.1 uncharacterized protein LOC128920568 [Zeugodacus cucurbitae]XP_054084259.1 uncharacterized protein LOC128920568 [Zeugodacus cucurbitae]XP_054084305.1 uncharacterized protein LOC128920577 [Zeugodacus cucurbitae]XP_054084306.1 uncharacterized protein LOC128920577 [Zeugod
MDVDESQNTIKTVRSEIVTPVPAPRTQRVMGPSSAAAARDRGEEQPIEDQGPPRCSLCHRPHALKRCPIFQSMKPAQRRQIARAHGHCMTCLADDHATNDCWADSMCQYCHRPHHTMFHRFPKRADTENTTRIRRRPQRDLAQRRGENHNEYVQTTRSRPRLRPQLRIPPPRRTHQYKQRRSTGLRAVVNTLQQLQRLLGD